MKWAVLLKTEAGANKWFLFKEFADLPKAIQSHDGFRSTGFDCLLVFITGPNHLSDVLASLN